MSETSPFVQAARALREIEHLCNDLTEQAVHKANDRLMPGGHAMVALGPAASPEAWEHQHEAREAMGRDTSHVAEEDDSWEPPLQALLFWSEAWRRELGMEYDDWRPTVRTEAAFLRNPDVLSWAWDNEVHFNDFLADVKRTQARLENVLYAGIRPERGVPCLYETCRGVRIQRKLVPGRDDSGQRTWRHTNWTCPRCGREWDEARYRSMVTAAHVASEEEWIDGVRWVSIDRAARELGRSVKTIRTWIVRGYVSAACVVRGRRDKFVRFDQVEERHEAAKKRGAA